MFTNANLTPLARWLARGLSVLTVAALLLALFPAAVSAAPLAVPKCSTTYEVKRGDTLNKIGSLYGKATNQIAYANNWVKPYTIYVGQRICIPAANKSDLPKLESKYVNKLAVYFASGRMKSDEIAIYTYNYPSTTVLVKVTITGDSARKFYTVGTINIAEVGNRKAWSFKLPTALQKASSLYICLKDTTTSYLQCVYPRRGS